MAADTLSTERAQPPRIVGASRDYTDRVQVRWNPGDYDTAYEIWRSTDNVLAHARKIAVVNGTNNCRYADRSARPGLEYYYWILGKNAFGVGSFSTPDSGTRRASVRASNSLAGATEIRGSLITLLSSNVGATLEPAEPTQYDQIGKTVWFKWVATRSGEILYSAGSAASSGARPSFNVSMFTSTISNPTMSDLVQVGDYTVVAGQAYWFQIGSDQYEGSPTSGAFNFEILAGSSDTTYATATDNFADTGTFTGLTVDASAGRGTLQTDQGETVANSSITQSSWWNWTAPASGTVDLYDNSFPDEDPTPGDASDDGYVRVYTGDSLADLAPVIDNWTGTAPLHAIRFCAVAGTTYRIQFSNVATSSGFGWTLNEQELAPTDVQLKLRSTRLLENSRVGTLVGTLSSTSMFPNDTFTYALVPGEGSADNASFTIVRNQLKVNGPLDFETGATKTIRIQVTDRNGADYDKVLSIVLTDVNEAPTALSLTAAQVQANAPVDTTVGTLLGSDPDQGNTLKYSLVRGTGATDNSYFKIVNGQIVVAKPLSIPGKTSYSIRVRITDQRGLKFEQPLLISIL